MGRLAGTMVLRDAVMAGGVLLIAACAGGGAPARPAPLAGFTLPQLDLSRETARQVVVDREAGQYLGHPSTELLPDGRTLLAVYPKGHGKGAIILKRSQDGGLTWSERQPVPENWATSLETPTLYRLTDRAGRARLVLFSGLYPIRMATSLDDGRTWTPLAPIGDYGGIVAMADVMRLRNGDHLAFFHDDGRFFSANRRAGAFTVYQVRSGDGGATWSRPSVVASVPGADLCEPGAIRSPDGRTIALLLRENSRRHNSYVTFSRDEGASWSTPVELPGSLTGDRHQAVYAPDGRLFISFRDMARSTSTRGDWVGWVGTWEDIVRGREGQYRVRLMENTHEWDSSYPALERLPDGTIVATTYGHWTAGEPAYVVSVRFTLAELDAKLAATRH